MPDSDADVLLLYGILDEHAPSAPLVQSVLERRVGVRGAPLGLVATPTCSVLAASVPSKVLSAPDASTLLAYRATVDAVHDARTIVPLRFGTTAETRDEAHRLLAPHREAFHAHLDRLHNQVEVGVRLHGASSGDRRPAPESAQASTGRAYLEARRDERTRREARDEAVATAYRTAVESVFADWDWERRETDDGWGLSLTFLVPQSRAEAVCERLQAVEHRAVSEAHVVGPWAPYSFVTL